MIDPCATTRSVLTFGEALVGYVTLEDSLRIGSQFSRFPGGADLNVAVALTRLGTAATWASVLGDDPHGDYLADTAAGLGVALAVTRAAGSTALMFKAGGLEGDPEVLQVRQGTAFSEHARAALTPELLSMTGISHLHLTGVAVAVSAEARAAVLALLEAAESHGATISFDPNLRLNLWPDLNEMRAAVNGIASRSTIVLPGLGEGNLLTGHAEPEAIADFYLEAGAREVVVKLGAAGAQAWNTGGTAVSQPYRVIPIDTVGAGDGFAAGYLDGYLTGQDLRGRVDRAAAVGALVTTRRGDLVAMPTRSELDAFLARQGASEPQPPQHIGERHHESQRLRLPTEIPARGDGPG